MAKLLETLKIPFIGGEDIKNSRDIKMSFYDNGRMVYNIAYIMEVTEQDEKLGIENTYDDVVLQSGYMWIDSADLIVENLPEDDSTFVIKITNSITSFKFAVESEEKAREYAKFINQFIEDAKK